MTMLADVSAGDLNVLFVLLAIVAFGAAVYAGWVGRIAAAVALALIGVVILVVGA